MASKKTSALASDKDLTFPEFVLLKASAGAGKTHQLSLRFVQFLLSDLIAKKLRTDVGLPVGADLGNILAITFTRNAAREMKDRILEWLKKGYLGDGPTLRDLRSVISSDDGALRAKAGAALESLLSHYSDFQVETIDSFMTAVFDASTVDLGVSPDYEISLDSSEAMAYAFQRYLRNVGPGTPEGETFLEIGRSVIGFLKDDAAYIWDPATAILDKLKILHAGLMARTGGPACESHEKPIGSLHKLFAKLVGDIARCGLDLNPRSHFYSRLMPAVERGRFTDFLGASFKTEPVKRPASAADAAAYKKALRVWDRLEKAVDAYRGHYARGFFYPYLKAYETLERTLDEVKRQRGIVFLEDVYRRLHALIDQGVVPDVYFRLGEQIFHYMIDEFQDTAPLQWDNLRPLIENSLSLGGSLLLVGDTKQAIYGFRNADYEIQAELEKSDGQLEPFSSTRTQVRELGVNYRSDGKVLEFVKAVFLENVGRSEDYGELAKRSGLVSFTQDVRPERRGLGYAEYAEIERNDELVPEKAEIQRRVLDLRRRGYAYSDIGILTLKNDSVVRIASWLNEVEDEKIPFIPYSSLDIRKRKVTGEIFAFLRFLDSPPDDLSFATFLLSDLLARRAVRDGRAADREEWAEHARRFIFDCQRRKRSPLYTAFRTDHPDAWEAYIEPFFKTVGYLPLYDLVTDLFRAFGLFEAFPDEEATLAKFLEAIKDFEGLGRNDLGEFLTAAESDESKSSELDIDVSLGIDAVKVMSIHKAKGLGFPAVILLLYGEKFQPPDFYLGDGGPVRVYRLTKELAEADEELGAIYRRARERDVVDRLNTLYVALTRARGELHVVGVKGTRDKYPFDVFDGLAGRAFGVKPHAGPVTAAEPGTDVARVRFATHADRPLNPRAVLDDPDIRRGIAGHAILAELRFVRAGWEADVREAISRLAPPADERAVAEDAGRAIVAFFKDSPLAELFEETPDRRVFTEFEVCDEAGRTLRLDRVVVENGTVIVLDYKTGAPGDSKARAAWEESNKSQMAEYLRLIKGLFPEKTVQGFLVYIDRNRSERFV
jgi:ATP-dependent helicase/nuclease subunit A